jgi:hypothetical protein
MLDYLFERWDTNNLYNFIKRKENQTFIIRNAGNVGRLDLLLYLKKKGFNNFLSVLEGANNSNNIAIPQFVDYILDHKKISL